MVDYHPSYILELEPGVFRYAIPKNLNEYAYNYLASGLKKEPRNYDDGTYDGITYSCIYDSSEACINAMQDRHGNFGNYDGLDLSRNVPESELPDIALDLIKCHKKKYPDYRYPNSEAVVFTKELKENLGLSDKDVSYVFTSTYGHIEFEYLLDKSKHSTDELFKEYPNVYFYDNRICPTDSTYKVEIKYENDDDRYRENDHFAYLTDVDTGERHIVIYYRNRTYSEGNSRLDGFLHSYFNAHRYGVAKSSPYKGGRVTEMFNFCKFITEYDLFNTGNSDLDSSVTALYFESGELKTKEYFQSKGYKVYYNQ